MAILQSGWSTFDCACLAHILTESQRNDMRIGFYAGAACVINALAEHEAISRDVIEAITRELMHFVDTHAAQPPLH